MSKFLLCFMISSVAMPALAFFEPRQVFDQKHWNTASAHTLFGPIQDDTPLTLSQVEDLIKNQTPDNAIAIEIQRRGVAFQLTPRVLASLKRLNAGPNTIQALLNKGGKNRIDKGAGIQRKDRPKADFTPGKVTILVADFEGPNPKHYRVTENIIRQLRMAASEYPDLSIQALAQPITEQQGSGVARDAGRKRQASIVLWGYYGATSEKVEVSVYFEVLRAPQILPLRQSLETHTLPISELEGFKLQTRLSGEMTYLALLTIGLARFEAEDYEGAIDRLTKALSQANVPDQIIDPAGIYFYRGFAYDQKAGPKAKGQASADYDKAIADYDKAIEIRPDLAWAYVNRGIVYSYKGQYERAIADYDLAAKHNPTLPQAYYNRGNAYSNLGQYARAIADYDRTINLVPTFAATYIYRGIAYRNMGQYDRATADFDHAIRLDPEDADAYNSRGIIFLHKHLLDRAITDFNRAIKLKPNDAAAHVHRGIAYNMKGQQDNAIANFSRAIEIDPNLSQAYVGRGNAFEDRGLYDRAIADFNHAISLDPNDVVAYHNRAIAYQGAGDINQAISDFKRVLQMTDDPNLRQLAMQRLQQLGVR